jgi:hypothetical protein
MNGRRKERSRVEYKERKGDWKGIIEERSST